MQFVMMPYIAEGVPSFFFDHFSPAVGIMVNELHIPHPLEVIGRFKGEDL